MAQGFEELRERLRSGRTRIEAVEPATIIIHYAGCLRRSDMIVGSAVIDGRQKRRLIGREPTVFPVTPGAHEVKIYFGKGVRVAGCPHAPESILGIDLAPGELAELICGVHEEGGRLARRFAEDNLRMPMIATFLVGLTLGTLGAVFFEEFRAGLSSFMTWLDLGNGLRDSLSYFVSCPLFVFMCIFDAVLLPSQVAICIGSSTTHLRIWRRLGSPYYLVSESRSA